MSNEKHSVKDVISNFVFSFFSYAMPTAVLQFVIQPLIASRLGSELNGQYLTLMSLNYLVIGVTASVLNTVRMLQDKEYAEKGLVGDFNVIYLVYSIFILIISPLGYLFYVKSFDVIDIILFTIISLLYLYHDYIFAQYRLMLKYNKILINNFIIVIGYFVGAFLFMYVFPKWQIVIIVSYLFAGIYDFCNTTFIREPIRKTALFNGTLKKVIHLTGSNLLSSMIVYCDKLILYPILGGTSVSIYNTAAIVGKILILVSAPLNSVLLSYLVKIDEVKIKIKFKHVAFALAGIAVLYFLCVIIGYPLTNLLYPEWSNISHKYIPITVGISLVGMISGLLNTYVVRFYKTSFQILIQGVNLFVYLLLSLILLKIGGLMGFCVGALIASLVTLILMISICLFKKTDEKEEV